MKYYVLFLGIIVFPLQAVKEIEIKYPSYKDSPHASIHYISRLFIKCEGKKKLKSTDYILLSSFATRCKRNVKLQWVKKAQFFSVDIEGSPEEEKQDNFAQKVKEQLKQIGFDQVFTAQEICDEINQVK